MGLRAANRLTAFHAPNSLFSIPTKKRLPYWPAELLTPSSIPDPIKAVSGESAGGEDLRAAGFHRLKPISATPETDCRCLE